MAPRDIRVGLIGFGYVGRIFHAPLIAATPGLHLSLIGSSRGEAPKQAYPDAAIVADPLDAVRNAEADLIVLATPNDTHVPLAEAALIAGKHVVVDKPFTLTLAQARGLAALAKEADRHLSVFQNRRFDSDFLAVKGAVEGGALGDIVELRSEISRYRPVIRDRWRERAGPGAGIWYDLGPHLIDQAMVLFGPPETVNADIRAQRAGGGAPDWFHAVLGYGPLRGLLSSSMLSNDGATRFLVRGTKGSATKRRIDVQESQLSAGMTPGTPEYGRDPDPLLTKLGEAEATETAAPTGDYRRYYEGVRDAIRGTALLPVTPAQATTLMAVLEAGLHSAEGSRTVAPSYTEAERAAWPMR